MSHQPSKSNEDLCRRLRMVSNMINMGEKIRWGQETTLMDEAADALETKDAEREKAVEEALAEYKQFVLNVLDGIDIADGMCNTKAIRFALQSRTLTPPEPNHQPEEITREE